MTSMRMTLLPRALLGALLLPACAGDDGVASTSASTSSTTDASTTADTQGTTASTTDTAGTTTAGTASTSTSTSTGESTTTAGTTGPGTTTTGTTATSEATTSSTSEATTEATTTGGGGEAECKSDDECVLFSDCCTCDGVHVDEEVMPCDKLCIIGTCESLGVSTVSCRLDHCVAGRLHCDDAGVLCDAPVPLCEPGYLPEVDEKGTCYTGGCVPVHLCDVVPECSYCGDQEMCVVNVTQLGPKHRCEPIPAACDGVPECGCAGSACDQEPYDTCSAKDGVLSCSCPAC